MALLDIIPESHQPKWYFVEVHDEDGGTTMAYFDNMEDTFDRAIEETNACLNDPLNVRVGEADFDFVEIDKAHPDTDLGCWQVGIRWPWLTRWGALCVLVGLLYAGATEISNTPHFQAAMAAWQQQIEAKPSVGRPSGRRAQHLSD